MSDNLPLSQTPEDEIANLKAQISMLQGKMATAGMLLNQQVNEADLPIVVRLEKNESFFWTQVSRAGQLLGLVAVLGFGVTTCSFVTQIKQTSATTFYQVSREGRQLGRELQSGEARTGEGINFHFSAQHLINEGVIDDEIRMLYLLDYCEFVNNQEDFELIWVDLKKFYPDYFSTLTESMMTLSKSQDCSVESLEALKNGN